MPETVECACCKEEIDYSDSQKRPYGLYVGNYGTQYICSKCEKLPFIEVMHALDHGKVYVRGTAVEDVIGRKAAKDAARVS